jgi:inosose dehydratase
MGVRIGINPLTWSNDDMPELGGETPLEICLSEATEAGYAGIELGNKFPRRADTLKPILARHGLALVSGWYSGRLLSRGVAEEKQAIEDHLSLLAAMGCEVMVFAEVSGCIHGERQTPLSHRPVLASGDWPAFGVRLTEMAKYLAGRGLRMAFHHHMGTVVQSADDVHRLMEHTGDEVGLLLDTGHLTFAGADPAAIAADYAPRITHVHCKDVRAAVLAEARAGDRSFLAAVLAGVFTVPGDGCVDYRAVLPPLARARYAGWLVVEAEQDPAKAHPLTYARMGFEYLKKAAPAAGLAT